MAKSKIVITFNILPTIGNTLSFHNDLVPFTNLVEHFTAERTGISFVKIGSNTNETAANYLTALNLDYGSGGLYDFSVALNVVTITATQSNVVFSELLNENPAAFGVVITNEVEPIPFNIDTVTFLEATTNPVCTHVKVQVDTNELAVKVTSPLVIDPNLINPFFFEWVRGDSISIICENALADSDTENVTTPQTLSVSNIDIDIINSPTGATITINVSNASGLTLQYSLDNITFQSSNIFSGLATDSYTAYVKDQLGCEVNTPFEITLFTPDISVTVPEFNLSKAMSIRFKRDIVWKDCSDYKNEENTLSCEYRTLLPYTTIQQFQTCDLITTQFKSNYETLIANVIKSDGTKDSLSITKQSSNLDREDKRDAIFYDINGTQTGIYFTTGNTYDFTTGLPTGTYALNGALTDWGIVGNFVFLDGVGWFEIADVIFNDDVDADVLVINYDGAGLPATIIVSSNYNITNFEIYEFSIDFSVYNEQEIQVEILATDTVFESIRELSEKIEIDVRFEDTIELVYWNPTNTDVFYATGIKNKIRIPYEAFKPNIDPETEILKTDTNTVLLNSQMYETNILTTSPLTVGIMRQVTQALVHKELYFDEVKYVISDTPEIEDFGQTNLSIITATLIKDGNVYNSEVDGNGAEIEGESTIIGLLQNDDNYIKVN